MNIMDDANNPVFSDMQSAGCAALLPPYELFRASATIGF
jgi:hypothetical protein